MKLKINKFLFTLIALLFGFSGSVAAQYGVVENHYTIKGQVLSEKCQTPIPDIKVMLNIVDTYGNRRIDTTQTDADGNFAVTLITTNMGSIARCDLRAQDVDGKANKGDFVGYSQSLVLNNQDYTLVRKESWDNYYDSKQTYYIGMKFKDDTPCK
ncbi:MAG: radical SAM-associated putative lipoprotein [Bacteroidota bacterium]